MFGVVYQTHFVIIDQSMREPIRVGRPVSLCLVLGFDCRLHEPARESQLVLGMGSRAGIASDEPMSFPLRTPFSWVSI